MTDGGDLPGDRLERAARGRREAEGLRVQLAGARQHAEATAAKTREVRAALAEEDHDVERLESASWSRVVSSLRGRLSTDWERESAERDAARYLLADALARADLARAELESLQARLDALGDVEAAWQRALEEQERWAAGRDPATARSIQEISRARGDLLAEDIEAREAHAAGMLARDHLGRGLALLGETRSWSSWDTFGGGGLFTDMMKYDRLDDVARTLKAADAALQRFSRELADLHLSGVDGVRIDGFTQVLDVFFDNFFTDLAVRSRIRDAELRVGQVLHTVESTLVGLGERGRAIEAELGELAVWRERLLGA
ncbi:MAG: hypothetical protein WB441_14660 [Nocardioidaceae bacterium]